MGLFLRRAKRDAPRAGDNPKADDQGIANDAGHEHDPAGRPAQQRDRIQQLRKGGDEKEEAIAEPTSKCSGMTSRWSNPAITVTRSRITRFCPLGVHQD